MLLGLRVVLKMHKEERQLGGRYLRCVKEAMG